MPDWESVGIIFQVGTEPFGGEEESLAAGGIGGAAEKIVVAQAVLRDRDGVVLQADVAVIVELRHSGGIVGALVVGFFGEEHVVLAQVGDSGVAIGGGSFVPEGEMAFATEEVGAEDASVVAERGHGRSTYYGNLLRR